MGATAAGARWNTLELRNRWFADYLAEGAGFELLVRGRVRLVVGRRRQRNRTARRSRCQCASVSFDQLVPRTRARMARTSLRSTVGQRTAPRAPFHRSRDRARYRYYEGSRSVPRSDAVGAHAAELAVEIGLARIERPHGDAACPQEAVRTRPMTTARVGADPARIIEPRSRMPVRVLVVREGSMVRIRLPPAPLTMLCAASD